MSDDSLNALHIWLINLDGAKKRRAKMRDQLNAMGLNFTRFAAIDGNAQISNLKQKGKSTALRTSHGAKNFGGKDWMLFFTLSCLEKISQF